MSRANLLLFTSSGIAAIAAAVVVLADLGPEPVPEAAMAAATPAAAASPATSRSDSATAATQEPRVSCQIRFARRPLPAEIRESSGLARGMDRPDLFWTHNDAGGNPELFAIDENGGLQGRLRVNRARVVDWEDIASGPCDGGSCLYIGDIGDNDGDRSGITVYRIAEPTAGSTTADATPIHARYPSGSPDAEALFTHQGRLYLVTKGRRGPIRLYRFPESAASGGDPGTLQLVTELAPEPESEADMVTAAGASPDGRWVGIRTYSTLLIYPAAELLTGEVPQPIRQDLSGLREAQGEALALGSAGEVWTTTESDGGQAPAISSLTCTLPTRGAVSG